MKFGSVCSGIEAASVAWHPLGWRATWLAEIAPFPSAVLAHHYPDVPNYGDMTKLPERIRNGEIEAPDVFCGGTPCQAFSVAGLRKSLADARGNLSLTFCEIANEIDAARSIRGEQSAIVFWENVPGVLNTSDNAFGCFLAGLAGEGVPLQPAGGRWTNAGVVYGPARAVAWRVLDAQYFGVAQRRRRVFVVASARAGFDPAAVLFEFDGVRRDSAPSREAGQATAAGTLRSTDGGSDVDHARAGHVITMAHGQGGAEIGFDRGPTLTCNHEAPIAAYVTHSLRGEGFDASEDGTGRGTPLVPVGGVKYAHYSHDYAHDRIADPAGVNPALTNTAHASGNLNVAVPVAFPANLSGTQCAATENLAPSMGAKNPTAVAFQPGNLARGAGSPPSSDVFPTLKSDHGRGLSDQQPRVMITHAIQAGALRTNPESGPDGVGVQADKAYTLEARPEVQCVQTAMQVRRLTPVECERLQGFPDGYTAIPWRGKPADQCPDGPRYKALGNSWAVPNVRWIGQRIRAALMQHANDNIPATNQKAA